MAINCYLILGVAPDTTSAQIRKAHRSLCRRYHPDSVPEGDERHFKSIQQAYETLMDPVRRAEHDRLLSANRAAPARPAAAPRPRRIRPEPIDLFRSYQTFTPSLDEMFDLYRRHFTGLGRPKSNRADAVHVEVVLSPDEALRGGCVPLQVPTYRTCALCGGTGRTGFFACDACGGHGLLNDDAGVDVLIPRGVADGTVIPVSLRSLGAGGLSLNVHIRVAAG